MDGIFELLTNPKNSIEKVLQELFPYAVKEEREEIEEQDEAEIVEELGELQKEEQVDEDKDTDDDEPEDIDDCELADDSEDNCFWLELFDELDD